MRGHPSWQGRVTVTSTQRIQGLDSRLADAFSGGFFIVLGLWLAFWAIPRYITYNFKVTPPTPEAVPTWFSFVMVLLGTYLLVRSLLVYLAFRQRQRLAQTSESAKALETMRKPQYVSMKPIAFVVWLLALLYAIALPKAGFLLGTCVLIIVVFVLFRGKKWWQAAILSVCVTGILWGVFGIYLYVALPAGFWERFLGL